MTEAYTVVPLSALRKVIAARMVQARRTIPDFRVTVNVEVDALLALRIELSGGTEARVSMTALLVKACSGALIETPAINIQWSDEGIRTFQTADISVVTEIEGGLSTPIIRSAETKTIWEISHEVKELTARAARNALRMEEITGGSFSVSNLGRYGVDQFDAIINPPQCAILAISAARQTVRLTEQQTPRIATIIKLTLTVDHRAIDGASAAAFLSALKQRVEQPRWLATDTRD
jgi:pyruvate dehydrogenase E2 component (dihydrolipoamide acetyltransferase)